MKYIGGKARLAKKFAPILVEAMRDGRQFVEPFVGGCNLLPAIGTTYAKGATCSDKHPGLIMLYQALQQGWEPPTALSETTYLHLKENPDWSKAITTFAAFGCSFSGGEWAGYARGKKADGSPRNFAAESARKLQKLKPYLRDVLFVQRSYEDLALDERHVVYCDPPYKNTPGSKHYATVGVFDSLAFYDWCDKQASNGAKIYVSEFSHPERDNWSVVWDIERYTAIDGKTHGQREKKRDLLLEVTA